MSAWMMARTWADALFRDGARRMVVLGVLASVAAMVGGLSASPAEAKVVGRVVTYEVSGQSHEGYVAYDDRFEGGRPGVLVVHEWWGLNDYARQRAQQLARMGYVAFCADMYGGGRTTTDPKVAGQWAGALYNNTTLWRTRANAALTALRKMDRVDSERVAAIGYCFGGSTVLQLAYSGAALDGVVSFHGSLPLPGEGDRGGPKVLVLHGAADSLVPMSDVAAFAEAMKKLRSTWRLVMYGGAGHSFTNPAADALGMAGVGYDAEADQRSWQAMSNFFAELFRQDRGPRRTLGDGGGGGDGRDDQADEDAGEDADDRDGSAADVEGRGGDAASHGIEPIGD